MFVSLTMSHHLGVFHFFDGMTMECLLLSTTFQPSSLMTCTIKKGHWHFLVTKEERLSPSLWLRSEETFIRNTVSVNLVSAYKSFISTKSKQLTFPLRLEHIMTTRFQSKNNIAVSRDSKRRVSFSNVSIRSHDMICTGVSSHGPAIGLDWFCVDSETVSLDKFEQSRSTGRKQENKELKLKLSGLQRKNLLIQNHGYSQKDLIQVYQKRVNSCRRWVSPPKTKVSASMLSGTHSSTTTPSLIPNKRLGGQHARVRGWFSMSRSLLLFQIYTISLVIFLSLQFHVQ